MANAHRALRRGSALIGALCAILITGQTFAQSQTYAFDIPSEPLSAALRDFARASGQQIVFTEEAVAGKTSAALHGSFTADDALAKLTSGTSLVIEHAPNGGIILHPKNAGAASNE